MPKGVVAEEREDVRIVPCLDLSAAFLPVDEGLLADSESHGGLYLKKPEFNPASFKVVADGADGSTEPLDSRRTEDHSEPRQKGKATMLLRALRGRHRPLQVHACGLESYRNRISGPLLDRFDLQIEVPRVSFGDIAESVAAGESAQARDVVARARAVQLARAGRLNARLDMRALWRVVELGAEERALLKRAVE